MALALPIATPELPAPWSSGPTRGSLAEEDARSLVDALAERSPTPLTCWYGLWDGYGWLNRDQENSKIIADEVNVTELARGDQKFRIGDCQYLLYHGEVRVALALLDQVHQTPNLWWPDDRSWCVVSEIDLDCTYVGGSAELIETILRQPGLEAVPAKLTDRAKDGLRGHYRKALDEMATVLSASGSAELATPLGRLAATLQRDGHA